MEKILKLIGELESTQLDLLMNPDNWKGNLNVIRNLILPEVVEEVEDVEKVEDDEDVEEPKKFLGTKRPRPKKTEEYNYNNIDLKSFPKRGRMKHHLRDSSNLIEPKQVTDVIEDNNYKNNNLIQKIAQHEDLKKFSNNTIQLCINMLKTLGLDLNAQPLNDHLDYIYLKFRIEGSSFSLPVSSCVRGHKEYYLKILRECAGEIIRLLKETSFDNNI
jgi:hypothetical protein